jgi:hypothetical protein
VEESKDPNEKGLVSFPNAMDIVARTQFLQNLVAYGAGSAILHGEGAAERVLAANMTSPIFRALGVAPLLGRTLTPGGRRPRRSEGSDTR